ncbi:MAG: 3-phosphoshikimate 1-carboxyvinyltransferase [Chloroflexi bacterium]|nr:3-phosphoshikimate 1-carboxyvinyltransferase [Chloroflexota bacterium]
MILRTAPSRGLSGHIRLPGDKSISHRAALFAALADGTSHIDGFLSAGVTHAMLDCLTHLGVAWTLQGERLEVSGSGLSALRSPGEVLDCRNSGTTLRLLAGALAASGSPALLDGSEGLRKRPMRRLLDPLNAMGVPISGTLEGTAPLKLEKRATEHPLRGGTLELEIASAQVKSAVLLAGLAASTPVLVSEPGPSRDHTERLLAYLGLPIRSFPGENRVELSPTETRALPPFALTVPGDFSSAAFLIVATLILPDSHLEIGGVGLNSTRTGLLDALQAMGAEIIISERQTMMGEPVGNLAIRASGLKGIDIAGDAVVRMIDEFPALAVAAAFAEGITRVHNAAELRYKETDRIHALVTQLADLGVAIQESEDGFAILGRTAIPGGQAAALGDHRLALALGVLGLASQNGVDVHDGEILLESFPNFVELITQCGGQMELSE